MNAFPLRLFVCCCLAVMVITRPAPAMAQSQRAIPDDNLAYPVLITLSTNSGSGFYVNNGKEIYLVTAKHVIADPDKGDALRATSLTLLSYSKDPADSSTNLMSLDLVTLQKDGNIKLHPSQDVAAIRVSKITGPAAENGSYIGASVPGVRIDRQSKTGILSVTLENIKSFADVLVGNDVMLFGYPSSIGLENAPQFDSYRPLLRKGIIAGSDPANKTLILDCPSYFGNSGGPVVEVDRQAFQARFTIVGVVIQYIPFVNSASSQTTEFNIKTNSGYSVALPMDFVLDLVK